MRRPPQLPENGQEANRSSERSNESFENGRRYIVEKAELTELIRSIPLATMGVSSPVAPNPAVNHSFIRRLPSLLNGNISMFGKGSQMLADSQKAL